jgi:hypothetical protein
MRQRGGDLMGHPHRFEHLPFTTPKEKGPVMAQPTLTTTPPTVVLVHGAFVDASSWTGVIERLQAHGVPVIAPTNPLRGIAKGRDGMKNTAQSAKHSRGTPYPRRAKCKRQRQRS